MKVDPGLTRNAFLGGALHILQPEQGYRAGADPVLLAASVTAKAGDSLLDMGCGVGVAALCAGRRVPGLELSGLELQPDYAILARRNAQENDLRFDVTTGDLSQMPDKLKERQFTHVIANPPYFDRDASTPARDLGRETALGGSTPLDEWIKQAAKRTQPGGTVTFIQRVERVPEVLFSMRKHLGSIALLPLAPRLNRSARLCLIRARKGGRADFRLHSPWVLHDGEKHQSDCENYTKATACVLREGAPLPFPD